jgi:hypothetical protein
MIRGTGRPHGDRAVNLAAPGIPTSCPALFEDAYDWAPEVAPAPPIGSAIIASTANRGACSR